MFLLVQLCTKFVCNHLYHKPSDFPAKLVVGSFQYFHMQSWDPSLLWLIFRIEQWYIHPFVDNYKIHDVIYSAFNIE